jgi:dolichol-phosphate mannosyltransferase
MGSHSEKFAHALGPNVLDLTVLILAKHEAANLRQLLPAIRTVLDRVAISYELVIVVPPDDRDTAETSRANGAVVVIQTAPGYGSAFRQGLANSSGRYIAAIDADLSHNPEVIAELWRHRDGAGVVIASRYVPGGRATMPYSRLVLSRILNSVVRRGLSLQVRDVSSGFRLYRRDALQHADLRARNFDVLEEVLIQIVADGWQIREIPFHYQPREHGRSKARLAAFAWSFLRSFVRMWRLRNSAFSADYDERAFNSVIPLQRYWQRTRHKIITGFASRDALTLDIGCGSSRIIQDLPRAVALDIQLKKLRRIQRVHTTLVQATLTCLPFRDGAFEALICSQVIEHVPHELVDFSEMNRVLAMGGLFTVGTPDYGTFTWPLLERLYGLVHPAGYVHEHINHYTAASLARELEESGFEILDSAYVGGGELIYQTKKVREAATRRPAPELPARTSGLAVG